MIHLSRFSITLAVVFLLASSTFAQIGIGFRAGVLSSNQNIKFTNVTTTNSPNGPITGPETDPVTGFIIGIPIEIKVSKILALQAEINYLTQGYSRTFELLGSTSGFRASYKILEVPFLAKIGWINEKISLTAVVGPSFQYTLSGINELSAFDNGRASIPASSEKIDFTDQNFKNFNRSNIYGHTGIQLGIPVVTGKFVFDARYRFALNDQDSSDDSEVKGRGVSATIGYIATFGK